MATFGERLKYVRTMRNMTQLEVAEKAGMNNRMVSMAETDVHVPSIQNIYRMADALNVFIVELLYDEDGNRVIFKGRKNGSKTLWDGPDREPAP